MPGARLHVEYQNGHPFLMINDALWTDTSAYFRGGVSATSAIVFNGKQYRGAIRVTTKNGKLIVTNILPLETYLVGMLASEMSPSWEPEVLKAQAVAARSYSLYMMAHPKDGLYDLESGIQDQVYGGVSAEDPRVTEAIRATTGHYLSFRNEPIKAFFHSRCGGMTETAQTVWQLPSKAHGTRVTCPYCRKRRFSWSASVELPEFFRLIGVNWNAGSPFHLLPDVSPSGRVHRLRVMTTSALKTLTSDELRQKLGYTRLKSAFFDWSVGTDSIHFSGKGAGHGVGMCQWGARGLAQFGKKFTQILGHFYPDALLTKVSETKITAQR